MYYLPVNHYIYVCVYMHEYIHTHIYVYTCTYIYNLHAKQKALYYMFGYSDYTFFSQLTL